MTGGRHYNTVIEEAERLSTTVRHLRGLVTSETIPYVKLGRLLRFDPVVVDEFLAAGACEL